ncbi:MAG: hypothetical protein ACLP6E_12920 [Acidimicrobiales bacterium]
MADHEDNIVLAILDRSLTAHEVLGTVAHVLGTEVVVIHLDGEARNISAVGAATNIEPAGPTVRELSTPHGGA